MKNRLLRIKLHFYKHRFAYGVATGLSAGGYLLVKQGEQWNEFLTENDLWDTFYDYSDEVIPS
jgi:hypothetical protein